MVLYHHRFGVLIMFQCVVIISSIYNLSFEGQFTKFGNLSAEEDRSGGPTF